MLFIKKGRNKAFLKMFVGLILETNHKVCKCNIVCVTLCKIKAPLGVLKNALKNDFC